MYKTLLELEKLNLLNRLVNEGIISLTIFAHKEVYERYLQERKNHNTVKAVQNTSDICKIPESSIYKIMQKMK